MGKQDSYNGSKNTDAAPSGGKVYEFSDGFFWAIVIFYFLYQFSGGIKNASLNFYAELLETDVLTKDSITGVLGIVGAVPMAVSIVFIAPLCNKFGKRIVTVIGMIVGVVGGVLAGIFYDNMVVAAVGIALKCLGSAPAGYMILAMIADSLDHIEAKCGFRCDGFVMSIYSSIMIASTPVAQGITSALVGSSKTGAVIAYIWVETVCYGLGAIVLLFFGVEKFLKKDRESILARQKAEAEAAGIEWVTPEERLKREEEEAEREAEKARIEELKARCEKKGLDFEQEERCSSVLMMHALVYKTQVLRDCGLVLPEHTFYVDNIYLYKPLPHTKRLCYLELPLYHYLIGRVDQSVSHSNITKRYLQQIRVMKEMVSAYSYEEVMTMPKGLRRYMKRVLGVIMTLTVMFTTAGKDNIPARAEAMDALWEFSRARDKKLFRFLSRRTYPALVYFLPFRLQGMATELGYRFFRERIKCS